MDDGLISRAKKGDEAAFEELLRLYEKKVYSAALRMSGNHDDALDLAQEVFLRVYRAIGDFREESSFSTWLYRICANTCLDFCRKNKKRALSLTETDEDFGEGSELDIRDETYDPETSYEKLELREDIEKALALLSPDHRSIIILREINGLKYDEIAVALDIEEGTVRSRLARARLRLRELLFKNGNFFERSESKSSEGGELS